MEGVVLSKIRYTTNRTHLSLRDSLIATVKVRDNRDYRSIVKTHDDSAVDAVFYLNQLKVLL